MNYQRCFPSVTSLIPLAKSRIPRFAWDDFTGGIGREYCLHRNVEAVNRLLLKPQYLVDIDDVNFTTTIFGQSFAVPFGVAPIGLGGGLFGPERPSSLREQR